MKKCALLLALLLLAASLSACTMPADFFGFRKADFTLVSETDTHGGFHGDGMYCLILDCADNSEKAAELLQGWNALPLPENLQLIMYGGTKDGVYYAYHLAKLASIPEIRNGFYSFTDRSSESIDPHDPSALLDRYSFNFSLGLYDADTDTMYYFEYDT